MSTGMRAERAQASASRVTGHASASMMRVGMGGPSECHEYKGRSAAYIRISF